MSNSFLYKKCLDDLGEFGRLINKSFWCFSFSSPSETVTYPTPVDSSRTRSSRIFQKTFLNKQ